jgi:hypothetical protein
MNELITSPRFWGPVVAALIAIVGIYISNRLQTKNLLRELRQNKQSQVSTFMVEKHKLNLEVNTRVYEIKVEQYLEIISLINLLRYSLNLTRVDSILQHPERITYNEEQHETNINRFSRITALSVRLFNQDMENHRLATLINNYRTLINQYCLHAPNNMEQAVKNLHDLQPFLTEIAQILNSLEGLAIDYLRSDEKFNNLKLESFMNLEHQ